MPTLNNGSSLGVKGTIDGTKLQRHLALGRFSQTVLGLVGHELQIGEVALTRTTPRQTAAITTVPMSLLRTIRRATPLEVWAMKRGDLTVETVRAAQLHNVLVADDAVDKFIAEVGLSRIWAGIERATASKGNGSALNSDTPANGSANDNLAAATLGGRIHLARKGKQLSLQTVGAACGVSPQAVGQWEHNEAKPAIDRLTRLAEILEIEVEALLEGDNPAIAELFDRFNSAF